MNEENRRGAELNEQELQGVSGGSGFDEYDMMAREVCLMCQKKDKSCQSELAKAMRNSNRTYSNYTTCPFNPNPFGDMP